MAKQLHTDNLVSFKELLLANAIQVDTEQIQGNENPFDQEACIEKGLW